jgi:hypothetical protein
MFICQITGQQSKLGEKLNKITVAKRPRTYTRWVKDEETLKYVEVECGRGWEIVRELNACAAGVEQWNAMTPEQQALFLKGSAS